MPGRKRSDHALIAPPRIGWPVVIATLAINLLGLALPLVVLQVFDRVIPFESYSTLTILFIGLCATTVLDFSLKWARIVYLGYQGQKFELNLGSRFLDRTLGADPEDYCRSTTGTHFERLSAVSQLRDYYAGQGRLLAIDLPFTAIFILMIGLIGGWLVAIPLVSLALLFLFKIVLQRAQGPIFESRKTLDGRRYSFLIECLSQIVTVKAQTMEPQLLRRYELLQDQSVNISHKLIQFSGISQSFGALFSQAAVAAMGLFGGYLIIIGQIGMAELAACMLLNGRTVQPLLKMLSHWVQAENVDAANKKIDEVAALRQRPAGARFETDIEGHLTFRDVTVARDNETDNLFSNVSFDVPAGTVLSVVGDEDASKLALLRLILAEAVPTSGSVLLDGKPISAFSATRGMGGIVYVDQSPAIFSGTILENISCFGDADAVERALAYSRKIGLEKIVHRMPLGYSTPIGQNSHLQNGFAMSQAISLVRALAMQPRLLLISSATSALDERSVSRFAACLQELKGHTTIVMATPRDQLLDLADQSVLLVGDMAGNAQIWGDDIAEGGDAVQTAATTLRIA
ncbi:ATP-binding cassette domain-containing protein [Roseobacter sp. YSTF-M11]|uniref:ATP-binding cassette domain-containing protein n=1 Tax=Roseobacter insulae TaxID=2859783 RepID=A0A9X1FVS3_9RHOB|nr:ABC transporter transmembrane domain-containing protein [Roseobacter insulae]MBW4708950.1 ATP-binding cassette domain-containing protein [Roseobacter insulae]